ncbi:hypothetical protein BDK51DRAFT_49187 [Blyttiomyces helicus]|uniref:Uncharacterized protein n=1 Tax=Blyttiomyces helicus TaxID=388810 RepID=A0A4P9VX61_9FUNG|nr:hypothetical protein BDK51DRAFT_49187 [Blyttiomyces helicus]|eukprot:RKO84309.1 hypothetical protein BDK51DRAFT_49187 [Blyttiomyces helicus]
MTHSLPSQILAGDAAVIKLLLNKINAGSTSGEQDRTRTGPSTGLPQYISKSGPAARTLAKDALAFPSKTFSLGTSSFIPARSRAGSIDKLDALPLNRFVDPTPPEPIADPFGE